MGRARGVIRKRLAGLVRGKSSDQHADASVRAAAADHPGLLIIRAWIERGSPEPLRAHIRLTTDVSAGFERSLTLTRADDVCATVAEWLSDCAREAASDDTPSAGEDPD